MPTPDRQTPTVHKRRRESIPKSVKMYVWQREPASVWDVATRQIDEYERKNEEWSVPYREQLRMRDEAAVRAEKATENLTTLLPRDYGYVYKGHRYLVPSDTGKLGVSKKL